jgi:hypothetical protein
MVCSPSTTRTTSRTRRSTPAPLVPYHPAWQPGHAQTAAEGGAGRRPAKRRGRADRSIARSAPIGAAAPLPRGASAELLDTCLDYAACGLSKWPHPYHGSDAQRRAIRRLRSSRDTVSPKVMGPLLASRAVPGGTRTCTLRIRSKPRPVCLVPSWSIAAGRVRRPACYIQEGPGTTTGLPNGLPQRVLASRSPLVSAGPEGQAS